MPGEQKSYAERMRPMDGYELVREPEKCPKCGRRLVVWPCLACACEAQKQRARVMATAGETSWEN